MTVSSENTLVNIRFVCRQQKLKEEREAKRSQLDERHTYVLQIVADSLGLERSEVEDAILEGSQVRQLIISIYFFFKSPSQKTNVCDPVTVSEVLKLVWLARR